MASVTGTLNWQNYPSCLSERSGVVELDSLREKLIQDAPRLFAGQGDIEVWFRNGQNEGKTIPSLRGEPLILCRANSRNFSAGTFLGILEQKDLRLTQLQHNVDEARDCM